MSDPKKKAGVAIWASVVVVVGLLYPIRFGPACWLTSRGIVLHTVIARAFYPIVWLATFGPRPCFSMISEMWW
jgi:hypothetical protein